MGVPRNQAKDDDTSSETDSVIFVSKSVNLTKIDFLASNLEEVISRKTAIGKVVVETN